MRSTDKEKLEEMTLAVELWQESGLSQRAYCKQEGYTIRGQPLLKSYFKGSCCMDKLKARIGSSFTFVTYLRK